MDRRRLDVQAERKVLPDELGRADRGPNVRDGLRREQVAAGPFVPQKNNPILRTTTGLITGTAHGCVVEGPHHSLLAFYNVKAAVVHGFERRLGMDPASFGEDGELHVNDAGSLPQRLPTASSRALPTGWLPLNAGPKTVSSTDARRRRGRRRDLWSSVRRPGSRPAWRNLRCSGKSGSHDGERHGGGTEV